LFAAPRAGALVLAAALVCAVGSWSRRALAFDEFTCPIQSSGDCSVLARRLFLIRGSMPDDLECQNDEDGNGLDDAMERQLACCFSPLFAFDPDENATASDEPALLFNAQNDSSDPDHRMIRLAFVALWRHDGGYASGDGHDKHDPDAQGFSVYISRGPRPTDAWGFDHWSIPDCGSSTEMVPNLADVPTHPVLYASAGKHHWYCHADTSDKDTLARGTGDRKFAQEMFQLPQFWPNGDAGYVWTLFDAETQTVLNLCELATTGERVTAQDLGPFTLGFALPGVKGTILDRYLKNPNYFGHDQVDGVGPQIVFKGKPDFDGDGLADMETYIPIDAQAGKWKARRADDMCPDGAPYADDDGDGDGIEDACDPDLFFKEKYVAYGSSAYPTTLPSDIIDDAWTSTYPSHWDPTVPRQGFLDTDVDGVPDGEDFCPLDNHYPYGYPYFDDNSWGEDQNWPRLATAPAATPSHTAGELHRGNSCDPYPLGITALVPEAGYGSACSDSFHYVTGGDNAPRYTVTQENGVSVNGAKVSGEVDGQTYRCACRNRNTGKPITDPVTDCLDQPQSDCFRRDVPIVNPLTANGYGYLPVQRKNCAQQQANGFCAHYPIDSGDESWDWVDEYEKADPSKPPHFGPGDVIAAPPSPPINPQPYLYSRYQYAIMTLSDIDAAPARDQQLGSLPSPFPDPLYVTGDDYSKGLGDVTSPQSKRLRATFTGNLQLSSEHQVYLPPKICNDPFHLGFAAVWAQYQCVIGCDPLDLSKWWEDPDPFQIVRNDTTLSGLVLVRPAEGYTSSIVADETAQELLGSSPVLAAPMPTGPDFAGPSLMVLGTSRAGTSWLLLAQGGSLIGGLGAPVAAPLAAPAGPPSRSYYTADEGELPVALAQGSRLLTDRRTDWAALFVPGSGVWGFDPLTATWRNAGAPAEVVSRGEPALAMVGDALVVAGGVTAQGTASDAWAVSLAGHGSQLLTRSLPPRRSALLAVKADSSGLAYGGGFDDSGAARDDIWSLDREPGGALSVRLVSADTGRGIALTPNTAGLDLPPLGGRPRLYRLDPSQPTGVTHELRTRSGWSELGLDGSPMPACPADDPHGGEVCRLDPAWWSDAGTRSCAASGSDMCTGARGKLLASQHLPAKREPDAVWAGHGAVWVLAGRRLERWDATTPGAAVLSAGAWLPKAGTMLAGHGSEVLVGTKAGVQRAALGGNGITLGPVLELCGHPLAAAAVGDDTWAAVTEFGLVTLATPPDAAPHLLAQAEIGVNGGATVVRPVSGCGGFGHDHDGPGQGESGIDDNAVVAVEDAAHVFVVLKKAIAEVELTDLAAPLGARGLTLPHRIGALRLDALQGRAYGAGAQLLPIVDLRADALSISGEHQLASWVKRSDAKLGDGTRLSARIDGERVEVAWVAP